MVIDIFSLFPRMIDVPLRESILLRAQEKGIVQIRMHDIRAFTHDKHKQADDTPYGGGPGMVLKPEPIFEGVESVRTSDTWVILMSPQGKVFDQGEALTLSKKKHLVVICGHYEGVDNRVVEHLVDQEVSIGDYVLTNGSIAAVVVVDALVRLIPGTVGDEESVKQDTFSGYKLKYPQYTKPFDYKGMKVPDVLLSGNHEQIRMWREQRALEKTQKNRPDLL